MSFGGHKEESKINSDYKGNISADESYYSVSGGPENLNQS